MTLSPIFRLASADDAEAIRSIYAPFCESTAVSFEEVAPTVDEMALRIRTVSERFPWLVCELGGRVAGYAYAGPHGERAAYRWSANVSVYVGPEYHRSGVGRGLYASLFRLLVHLGYYKAFAGATLPNPGSVGLHEAVGFAPVGIYRGAGFKFGRWHDVVWWQLALQPEADDPRPPKRLPDITGTDEFAAALRAGLACVRLG